MQAREDFLAFISDAVKQGGSLAQKPNAYLITPGDDWPAHLQRPSEPQVYIPNPTPEMLKLIGGKTLSQIRETAEQMVKDMGLPPDATVDDITSGKLKPIPLAPEPQAAASKSPLPEKRNPGWRQKYLTPALLATTGIMGAAEAMPGNPAQLPARPAAVSTLEGFASGRQQQRHSPHDRKGASLVEVLVVMSIIGVVAGLGLPAIQQGRESMRRLQYKNNMRQVVTAISNFESSTGKLPYATSTVADDKGVLIPHNWVVDILPYMDQAALYNQYNQKKPLDQQSDEVKAATVAAFNHPSYPTEEGRMHMALLSSSGTSATSPDDINNKNGVQKDYILNPQPEDFRVAMPPQWVMNAQNKWQQNGQGTYAGVTDGTSNTAILATHNHTQGNRDPWLAGKTRITGLMFGTEVGQSRVNGGLTGNVYEDANFVTNHVIPHEGPNNTQGITVGFLDGSVRTVGPTGPKNASWDTPAAEQWRRMVTRDDGKTPKDDLTP